MHTFTEPASFPPRPGRRSSAPRRPRGGSLTLEQLPAGITLTEKALPCQSCGSRTPTASELISVTAVPLPASEGELIGVVAVYWRDPPAQP